MLTIRSVVDGRVLGFALNETVARNMADTNGWNAWVAEPSRMHHLEIAVDETRCDPRNRMGHKCR